VTGGGRPRHLARGWFIEPTVFAEVDNRSVIAQEEIFGPVLAVIPYSDQEEAIRIANDSAYGRGVRSGPGTTSAGSRSRSACTPAHFG
jgi:aldehyde dehydrogenase (NAD+)